MTAQLDAYQLSAVEYREKVKNKAYRAYPMGQETAAYLRQNRGRLTAASYRSYEGCFDKLARYFPDLELRDFEPPVGAERLEEFMDVHWGERAAGTFNTNHAMLSAFFKWAARRGKINGNPMLLIDRHKSRGVHREVFSREDRARIMADGPEPGYERRDKLCLHLLLKYGIRKGALRSLQFSRCDAARRRVTIFTKGGVVQEVPVMDAWWWEGLSIYFLENDFRPEHYLLCRRKRWRAFAGYDRENGYKAKTVQRDKLFPDKPIGDCGAHHWWYGCLARAGIVAHGTTSGEKMHKARHSAGQNLYDQTKDLKATQLLLGHSKSSTTADIYLGRDVDQLGDLMARLED